MDFRVIWVRTDFPRHEASYWKQFLTWGKVSIPTDGTLFQERAKCSTKLATPNNKIWRICFPQVKTLRKQLQTVKETFRSVWKFNFSYEVECDPFTCVWVQFCKQKTLLSSCKNAFCVQEAFPKFSGWKTDISKYRIFQQLCPKVSNNIFFRYFLKWPEP